MENRQFKVFLTLLLFCLLAPQTDAQEKKVLKTNGHEFTHIERAQSPRPPRGHDHRNNNRLCPDNPYRTIDGTCNNQSSLQTMEWGASDVELGRALLPQYGNPDHYNSMGGQSRVSPRKISNEVGSQSVELPSPRNLSSFVFTWGQFIDHDISLTPEGNTEYAPIVLPSGEPLFTSDIHFFRSEVHANTGSGDYRQQTNLITSYIDGSNVYGSDADRSNWLRTKRDGKLKMSKGDLLPFNTITGEYDDAIDTDAPSMAGDQGGTAKTFVAGDIRAAEQPGLTTLHTLFARHHNRICAQLKKQRIFSDEILYQMARKEVGAIIQAITYNEFLPALGLDIGNGGGYNRQMQADITNIFANAAYRFGHTMVTEELLLLDNNCNPVNGGSVSLLDGFFNPQVIRDNNIAPFLKGLSVQVQNEVDLKIIDNLRNFLFGNPSSGNAAGLDLASLNIQRGRDHGLPDYNSVRRHFTGRPIRNFEEINRDRNVTDALKELYTNVNDIDVWVGLLAEEKLNRSSMGLTMTAILRDQFIRLRDGDSYFYTNDRFLNRNDIDRIKATKLSDIINLNTNINSVQDNVFIAEQCVSTLNDDKNQTRSSEDLEEIKLSIFPNPAQSTLTVTINGPVSEFSHAQIVDLNGKTIKVFSLHGGTQTINVAKLTPGSYILVTQIGDKEMRERFIKVEE